MKLSFFGADQCVTGSCHCLDIGGKRILVDCGLQQGRDEVSNAEFPFAANTIDYLLVTHAHIDHSGRIPMLIKQGFQGKILTTRLTAELLDIMLLDSAHIQEQDAEWKNRKGERSGAPHVDPLYTIEDAQRVREFMTTCEYGQVIDLCEGVEVEFVDAGHLLGSACIAMDLTENGVKKRIVFSGDLGNIKQPIIRDPVHFHGADYVVMESTYGDRNHTEVWSYTDDLARIIDETMARGGNVIIPSFAVGRTQELLYFIREIKDARMVKSNPDFPVYIDSPLAKRATTIFTGNLHGYLDDDALKLVKDGTHMFNFTNLRMTETSEESKALNEDRTPKVIISASGMCDAGRIRHHLKHNLWRPECTVVFVGFQGEGTLGRHLLEGAKSVKLFGEEIAVNAQIVNFQGLSPTPTGTTCSAGSRTSRTPSPSMSSWSTATGRWRPSLPRPFRVWASRPTLPNTRRSTTSSPIPRWHRGICRSGRSSPSTASPSPPRPTSAWWRWARWWWRPSSGPRAGTTRPWQDLPISCGRSWKSGTSEGGAS